MSFFRFRTKRVFPHLLLTLAFMLASVSILWFSGTVAPAFAAEDSTSFLEAAPPSPSAYKADALLTLFYNGSSLGELHPCPT